MIVPSLTCRTSRGEKIDCRHDCERLDSPECESLWHTDTIHVQENRRTSDVCRFPSFKLKYAIGHLFFTSCIRLTWSVKPCYCVFEYWFSSHILIGTYSQVGYTQNSISYKWRSLQIYSNAIWIDKLSFNLLRCHEYNIWRYVEQVCYCIFRWYTWIFHK